MKVFLDNHVEASAFSVLLISMGFKEHLDEIGVEGDKWYVGLKKPLQPGVQEAIIGGIKLDQQKNPAKWAAALAEQPGPPVPSTLVPVKCDTKEQMAPIFEEMKKAALADPDVFEPGEGYGGHDTETGAKFFGAMQSAEVEQKGEQARMSRGCLRLIFHDHKMFNICLTLAVYPDKKQWNLSVSMRTSPRSASPERVLDEIANVFCDLAGGNFTEVEPKTYWKTIRHFVKDYAE
jgi:hypothetical protein